MHSPGHEQVVAPELAQDPSRLGKNRRGNGIVILRHRRCHSVWRTLHCAEGIPVGLRGRDGGLEGKIEKLEHVPDGRRWPRQEGGRRVLRSPQPVSRDAKPGREFLNRNLGAAARGAQVFAEGAACTESTVRRRHLAVHAGGAHSAQQPRVYGVRERLGTPSAERRRH